MTLKKLKLQGTLENKHELVDVPVGTNNKVLTFRK
jgi:hypothetical protein